jgi:hypothetical protein
MSSHDQHQCGGLTTAGVRVYGVLMLVLGFLSGFFIAGGHFR